MKFRMFALISILVLSLVGWSQETPSAPNATPAPQAKMCCHHNAASAKDAMACCGTDKNKCEMKDGKTCCEGKDVKAAMKQCKKNGCCEADKGCDGSKSCGHMQTPAVS